MIMKINNTIHITINCKNKLNINKIIIKLENFKKMKRHLLKVTKAHK